MKMRSLFSAIIALCFVFSLALAKMQDTKTDKKETATKSEASCCAKGSKADMKNCPHKSGDKSCCDTKKSGKMSKKTGTKPSGTKSEKDKQ